MTNSSNKVSFTPDQKRELIEQYAELLVDNMDTKTLAQYVYDDLVYTYEQSSSQELKEQIDDYDPELFEELVDNVTQQYARLNVVK